MKIICLLKFVPDTNQYEYDYKTDRINREKSSLILNPDDRNALAWMLQQKKQDPSIETEVVSMGPVKIEKELKNFIRLGVDHAVLISDRSFVGSDSFATSLVLAKYLSMQSYDFILTGTHTLDGGTGHIGPQVAELLGINQFSNIQAINAVQSKSIFAEALQEGNKMELNIQTPCILSVTHQMNLRLGFVRYEAMDKNVDTQFSLVTNEQLNVSTDEVGLKGSPTKVRKNVVAKKEKGIRKVLAVNDEGIDEVINYLEEKGYI